MFDSQVVEPGPASLITDDGIFLICNGGDHKNVCPPGGCYLIRMGAFDKNDPTKVLTRAQEPIFEPLDD